MDSALARSTSRYTCGTLARKVESAWEISLVWARAAPINSDGRLLQGRIAQIGAVLDLQLEPAQGAQPVHRRGAEHPHVSLLDVGLRRSASSRWP